MTFGEVDPARLRALRGTLSREELASRLRTAGARADAKAVWRWETGRNVPSTRVLPVYAAALGVSVDELLGGGPEAAR
jgi:transcriptional regulator with XRE-family HTH domain